MAHSTPLHPKPPKLRAQFLTLLGVLKPWASSDYQLTAGNQCRLGAKQWAEVEWVLAGKRGRLGGVCSGGSSNLETSL